LISIPESVVISLIGNSIAGCAVAAYKSSGYWCKGIVAGSIGPAIGSVKTRCGVT